jgi:PAS domain S-box-containing protein
VPIQKQYTRIDVEDYNSPNLDISPEHSQRAYLNILEDMQGEKQAMEDQRKATFNILEDITAAQEELKFRLLQVDTMRQTLESLSISVDSKNVMETITKSIQKLVPYYSLSYVIYQGQSGLYGNTLYINSKGPIGRIYISSIQKDVLAFIEGLPAHLTNKNSFLNQLRQKMYSEFISGSFEEGLEIQPISSYMIPLNIRSVGKDHESYILGLFHITSINPRDKLTSYQLEMLNDIANVSSVNLERIKSIAATEQARLASLLRSMSNGVILFDTLRNVLLTNASAAKMLGLMEQDPSQQQQQQQQQVIFKEIERLFDKDGLDFSFKINRLLEKGKEFTIKEFVLTRFIYEVFLSPVRDLSGAIIGGAIIIHDITHIKEIDRMKTEFVSVASHQLRTPLTAIKLFSEMLLNGEADEDPAKVKEYIGDIHESTERMVRLVNDLLNVSRLETGRLKVAPEPTQLEGFIQSIIDDAKPLAEAKKCSIIFNAPKEKLPEIPVDHTLMRQVIHNLITNAIRYSPEKKCDILVTLEHKNIKTPKERKPPTGQVQKQKNIKSKIENLKSDFIISVKDSGIGIPKKAQSRIFEKFFRADNAQKSEAEGSGLGLYVAKMVAEASGGKIWFESEEGKGTTFYVTIPMQGMKKKAGEKGLVA